MVNHNSENDEITIKESVWNSGADSIVRNLQLNVGIREKDVCERV